MITKQETGGPSSPKKRRNKYAELASMLLDDSFKNELDLILDSYGRLPRKQLNESLDEVLQRLKILAKGLEETILEVVSSFPEVFAKLLKRIDGDKEKRQLRLLYAKYNAFFLGIAGLYQDEFLSIGVEPFLNTEDKVVLRVTINQRNGNTVVVMDDAESYLKTTSILLKEIIGQRSRMNKTQLRSVESYFKKIQVTLAESKQ